MIKLYKIAVLFIAVAFLIGCATSKAQYKEEADKTNELPDKDIEKTFYLIGDAGKSPQGGMSKALTAFKNHTADKNTTEDFVLFFRR